MKIRILYIIIVVVFCILSCTTSRTVVSESAVVEKYQYASLVNVMGYTGSAELMDMEIQIYDAVASTRLKMIGDHGIEDLSDEQKEQLLLVRFSASQNDEEAVVSVNFVDYLTGKPVASCRGAFGLGLGFIDMETAISRVTKQIKELFK